MYNKMEIVFVQLGINTAPHLLPNISRLGSLFPEIPINLVIDKKFVIESNPIEVSVIFDYQATEEIDILLKERFTDPNFRGNFWRLTLERLIAFLDFHLQHKDAPMLHVESDILLMPNIPLERIANSAKLSWMRVDSYKDIASLLFSPSHQTSEWLRDRFIEVLESGQEVTDMTILRAIAENFPEEILLLPSLLDEENQADNIDEPGFFAQRQRMSYSWNQESRGIFDPAAIGMWLTGIDPRNQYGVTTYFDTQKVIKSGTYFNPSLVKYFFQNGNLFIEVDGLRYAIWNLHVHSKNLKLFSPSWDLALEDLVKQSSKNRAIKSIDLSLLANLLRQNYSNRTLLRYLMGIYPLNHLVNWIRGRSIFHFK
jgi:hypothetical protein